MTQRAFTVLTFILLLFALTGAGQHQTSVWNPNTYAIVGQAGEWDKQTFQTIQAAVDSGAVHIRVMAGEYAESVSISHALTLECDEGATLINDGSGVTFWIYAKDVTINGCTIVGNHDGSVPGDFFSGTGVHDTVGSTHIDGLKTVNLRGFSYINAAEGADDVTIENFDFRNVGVLESEPKCVATAILFIAPNGGHAIRNGYVTGYSQAIGLWYGVWDTTVQGNRLINNYGGIGGGCANPRSAIESFGLGRGNYRNHFFDNVIDGTRGAGFELADIVIDALVSRNTVRHAGSGGAFGVMGSENNKGERITIENNYFYGDLDGQDAMNWFSGSGVVRGNYFIDWRQENVGTILIPNNAIPNGLDVTGNYFIRNSRVMRVDADGGSFVGNTIEDSVYDNYLYFDNGVSGFLIADNDMRGNGGLGRAINTNGVTGLVVRNNYIEGSVWAGAQAVVEGNTIIGDSWTSLIAYTGGVYRNNRLYADYAPIVMDAATVGTLVERNYGTKRDGSAVPILDSTTCLAGNTCTRNWTSGQIPPP